MFWRKMSQIGHFATPANNSKWLHENMENSNRRGVNDYGIPKEWGVGGGGWG